MDQCMALKKKGFRLITIDGVVYRWRVRKDPLSFAIEQADRRGAILLGGVNRARLNTTAVPLLVAEMVRRGREQGWQPDQPGAVFLLRAASVSAR
jgi:hypothetical protein